ncbi:hypothetical protein TYRP_000194 [Tyrophagus putrescentiae]|nr:hypothetical protein TYRP_000194 [Tyrophagus putrescentiae]
MKLLSCFILSTIILTIHLVSLSSGQFSNNLAKNSKSKQTGKDRHFSKSYGEVQFNKYRGQLPAKGAMIQCAFDCLSVSTCHCIGINIQTSECHFFGLEESPQYDTWKVSTGNGSVGLSQKSTNSTNRDYLFFTRDIFAEESFDKVDIAAGRKVLTSWMLEQNALLDVNKKASSKSKQKEGKAKNQNKSAKSKFGKKLDTKGFPYPWVQFEFKDPMYITEILLKATKDQSNDLKKFHIRIGNESISKFYESDQTNGDDEIFPSWVNAKPYDRNNICFEYPTATSHGAFFSNGIKKSSTLQKTIKCQPCGLMGRFLVIQSMEPCPNCKLLTTSEKTLSSKSSKSITTTASPLDTVQLSFPIPLSQILIFGYSVSGKGRD